MRFIKLVAASNATKTSNHLTAILFMLHNTQIVVKNILTSFGTLLLAKHNSDVDANAKAVPQQNLISHE